MKIQSFGIYTAILVTIILTGIYFWQENISINEPTETISTQEKNIENNQISGLQKQLDLIESNDTSIESFITSKPEGVERFKWNRLSEKAINYVEGKEYELYALTDPNFTSDDLDAIQEFYLEVVKDNDSLFYGPFKTTYQDFTQ